MTVGSTVRDPVSRCTEVNLSFANRPLPGSCTLEVFLKATSLRPADDTVYEAVAVGGFCAGVKRPLKRALGCVTAPDEEDIANNLDGYQKQPR